MNIYGGTKEKVEKIKFYNDMLAVVNRVLYECIDNKDNSRFILNHNIQAKLIKKVQKVAVCGYKYPEIENYYQENFFVQ